MSKYIDKSEVQANNLDKVIAAEVYKPVVGFERYYMVSNYGNVMSLHGYGDTVYMSRRVGTPGYYTVCLSANGDSKPYLLHRLVAQAFIPNPENKATVNHKDGNKLNCYVENLEWATYAENNQHAIRTGLAVPNVGPMIEAGIIAASSPVLILETGEVFRACCACDEHIGQPVGYTSRIISTKNGYGDTVKLHFKYITQSEYDACVAGELRFEPQPFDAMEYLNRGLRHNSKCIRIVETGECFASGSDCDRKYNLKAGATSDVMKRADKYYGKMDWHIERISKEEYLAWASNPITKVRKTNLREQLNLKLCRGGYCVKIVETGECFATAKECDKQKGFPDDFTSITISRYGGHRKRASAYHFVKISAEEYLEYVRSQSNK